MILQGTHARGRCAACKALFDPDLEQGANTNIVVHRDPATGDTTRVLVHRWCSPGRPPRSAYMRWPMLEPYAGNLHVRF